MVDTSAIYALIDRSDDWHGKAKDLLKTLSEQGGDVILTNFIVAETHTLILSRLGHELARGRLKNLIWKVERVSEEDEKRAREIVIIYTKINPSPIPMPLLLRL